MRKNIALVDDDRNILTSVSMLLEAEGFQIKTYNDGASALEGLNQAPPDLGIFDIKMPRMDGMELLNRIRKTQQFPVIFLTSKDEEIDEVLGLRMGADDFIRKPFSQRLLLERIRAVLRRADAGGAKGEAAAERIVRGELVLDPSRHQCTWKGKEVHLTVTEFLLLKSLAERPGHIVIMLQERTIADKMDRQLTHRSAARSVIALAAMLAHEIKNPLSGIRGAAQLLEQSAADDDRPLTRLICDEADRIVKLVDRMEVFTDQLAARGYVTLAPALYSRTGTLTTDASGAPSPEARDLQNRTSDGQVAADLSAAITYLRGLDSVGDTKIGAVGFCAGGRWGLFFAADLLGYEANVNGWLEHRLGVSHRVAVALPAAVILFLVPPLIILLYFLRKAGTLLPGPGMSTQMPAAFGTTESVGLRLFTNYLLPFEVTGLLMLAAVIGAVVLARRKIG